MLDLGIRTSIYKETVQKWLYCVGWYTFTSPALLFLLRSQRHTKIADVWVLPTSTIRGTPGSWVPTRRWCTTALELACMQFSNDHVLNGWTGHQGIISWLARSTDITHCNFFMDYMATINDYKIINATDTEKLQLHMERDQILFHYFMWEKLLPPW